MKKIKLGYEVETEQNIEKDSYYWAGFFDGEGCILISKEINNDGYHKQPSHILKITIANTNETIMEEMKNFAGMNKLFKRKFKKLNQRDAYYLNIKGDQALSFLKKISPHLKLKKKQADLGIYFQENKKIHYPLTDEDIQFRENMMLEIRRLNHVDSNKGLKLCK